MRDKILKVYINGVMVGEPIPVGLNVNTFETVKISFEINDFIIPIENIKEIR